ncbi:unnamed protein product [Orchesella dallaii]|uniref:C2H2-type domain-containing protein n=1 Tax=Orchesella dallaii TaxID=48710 RepID=A0ABP1RIV5_9HEXA
MSNNSIPRILQELLKCKEKRKTLEEAVKTLESEKRDLSTEKATLQERVAELEAKLEAAETGKRVAEEKLADWKKGLEHLEELCDEESEQDDSASGSEEFERAEQVFENLKVDQPLDADVEIVDLTHADGNDDTGGDAPRGDLVVGVDQVTFVFRDTTRNEHNYCNEEYTENNGANVDVPDVNGGADDGIGNSCDAVINEQPAQIVSIKSVAIDLFSFQMDTDENDASSNSNQEQPPGTISIHSDDASLELPPTKSPAIHEMDYLKEPKLFCRCGKEFPTKAEIENHLDNYNNRRFCCKFCEKRFRFGSLLRYHLLRKHNATMVGGSFSCGKCGGQCATRSLLFKHKAERNYQ